MAIVGKSDFGKAVARTVRGIKERYAGEAPTSDGDKAVKEQVVADLEKLASKRELGDRF